MLTPWNPQPQTLTEIQDNALMTLANGKLNALEVRQRIALGTELANEAIIRLTRLYVNGQQVIQIHPELEGMVNSITSTAIRGVTKALSTYLNPGSDLNSFDGGWIYE